MLTKKALRSSRSCCATKHHATRDIKLCVTVAAQYTVNVLTVLLQERREEVLLRD